MRGPGACEALGLGFDQGLEGAGAQGALLLQGGADDDEVFRVQGFIKQGAVGVDPGWLISSQRQECRMRMQPGLRTLPRVGLAARPSVVGRDVGDGGPHRIELDIAVTPQHIVLAVH